jgi:hypothetical protein
MSVHPCCNDIEQKTRCAAQFDPTARRYSATVSVLADQRSMMARLLGVYALLAYAG